MTELTNTPKPFIEALRNAGASADIHKGMIVAGYRGRNYLFSFDGAHRDWFGEIIEVKTPQEAVSKLGA